jgi:putative PIN family toxin of toxin-antitoxin system
MIATLDTNVLLSGTLFGGIPGSIVDAAVDRRFILALSPAILAEYEGVLLRAKSALDRAAVEVLVRDMEAHALLVYPGKTHDIISRDTADNAIIDCAVEAKADAIVSGDAHLWELKTIAGIEVVTPARFLKMLD